MRKYMISYSTQYRGSRFALLLSLQKCAVYFVFLFICSNLSCLFDWRVFFSSSSSLLSYYDNVKTFFFICFCFAPNLFVFRLACIIFIRCDSIGNVCFSFYSFSFFFSSFDVIKIPNDLYVVIVISDKYCLRGRFHSQTLHIYLNNLWKKKHRESRVAQNSIILNYHWIQKLIPSKQPVSEESKSNNHQLHSFLTEFTVFISSKLLFFILSVPA